MFDTQFFLKFQLENQHVYYTRNSLFSNEVICILMRQKYKVEQLPVL